MNPPPISLQQPLRRFAKSRLALSTVVTTLIILVIAVLLAGVVSYFAINVTSTRVQEESIVLAKQHVWYDATSGNTQAAIMVINTGGRDIVIDRLTVRGQECDWSNVYYNATSNSIVSDFYYSTLSDGCSINIGTTPYVFEQATTDLTVKSGTTLIIYISNPDSISVGDVGLTVSVNIFTSQAMYYKETNVQGSNEIT
ncbi:MAG TPA: type IV pilin [Candidatus Acidoferrales bacterium]|nr:type IV pilin [Candidatus Acidoferrales bacterium]